MITSMYFEAFAPGMRAKLDPTYRHTFEANRLLGRAEILGKIATSSRKAFVPFTTKRNLAETSGRR